jgi:hypothetical protein
VARQQAAVEVARIEADGRAKLQADNAKRAHELELLRVRDERRFLLAPPFHRQPPLVLPLRPAARVLLLLFADALLLDVRQLGE